MTKKMIVVMPRAPEAAAMVAEALGDIPEVMLVDAPHAALIDAPQAALIDPPRLSPTQPSIFIDPKFIPDEMQPMPRPRAIIRIDEGVLPQAQPRIDVHRFKGRIDVLVNGHKVASRNENTGAVEWFSMDGFNESDKGVIERDVLAKVPRLPELNRAQRRHLARAKRRGKKK